MYTCLASEVTSCVISSLLVMGVGDDDDDSSSSPRFVGSITKNVFYRVKCRSDLYSIEVNETSLIKIIEVNGTSGKIIEYSMILLSSYQLTVKDHFVCRYHTSWTVSLRNTREDKKLTRHAVQMISSQESKVSFRTLTRTVLSRQCQILSEYCF